MILYKEDYWEKLTEYFYDCVYWNQPVGIIEWLKNDYNAETSYYTDEIRFKNDQDATMFMLRWG